MSYTPEKQAVADVIERYRQAVETRDVSVLRTLASDGYYENGSTTSDPVDDYNRMIDYNLVDCYNLMTWYNHVMDHDTGLVTTCDQDVKMSIHGVEIR